MLSGSELWLLRLMADRGAALLDASSLLIVLEERGELHVAASSGAVTAYVRGLPVAGTALGELYTRAERLSFDRPQRREAAWLHELGLEARSALIEPFRLEPHGSGMIIALRRDSRFRDPDRQALAAFAENLAARLSAERSAELQRLRYGLEMREHERTRWARELHDDTVQGLGALRMQLANARDSDDEAMLREVVARVLAGIDQEIVGIRHLITDLRPAALDDFGLPAALEALARRAKDLHGLLVRTEIALEYEEQGRRLDAELESTVYRIVQEALTNVARHAEATEATIALGEQAGRLQVTIEDNGQGLPPAGRGRPGQVRQPGQVRSAGNAPGGFGLPGMRERAELVGGELNLGPAVGGGALVRLLVPLANRPEAPGDQPI